MRGAQRDFSIGSFRIQRASDVAQIKIAERVANRNGAAGERTPGNPAIASRAVHSTFDIRKRDVPKAVGNIRAAANARDIDIAIIVANYDVAADVARLDAAERSGDVRRPGVRKIDGSIATGDVGRPLNLADRYASEAIAHLE